MLFSIAKKERKKAFLVLYPEDPDGSPHPSREKSKTEELIFTLLN